MVLEQKFQCCIAALRNHFVFIMAAGQCQQKKLVACVGPLVQIVNAFHQCIWNDIKPSSTVGFPLSGADTYDTSLEFISSLILVNCSRHQTKERTSDKETLKLYTIEQKDHGCRFAADNKLNALDNFHTRGRNDPSMRSARHPDFKAKVLPASSLLLSFAAEANVFIETRSDEGAGLNLPARYLSITASQ